MQTPQSTRGLDILHLLHGELAVAQEPQHLLEVVHVPGARVHDALQVPLALGLRLVQALLLRAVLHLDDLRLHGLGPAAAVRNTNGVRQ